MSEQLNLSELERLEKAATPAPWIAGRSDMGTVVDGVLSKWIYAGEQYCAVASGRIEGEWSEVMANANLIVALRNAAPALRARIRELEAERDEAVSSKKHTQKWYANRWQVMDDWFRSPEMKGTKAAHDWFSIVANGERLGEPPTHAQLLNMERYAKERAEERIRTLEAENAAVRQLIKRLDNGTMWNLFDQQTRDLFCRVKDCLTTESAPSAEAEVHPDTGVSLIAAERQRQVEKEGWTPEHDDEHESGELALAAACYASPIRIFEMDGGTAGYSFVDPWPWHSQYDKRYDCGEIEDETEEFDLPNPRSYSHDERLDLLIKAGALIAAEIDRLKRIDAARKPATAGEEK